ncbi:MAG: pentapeptide repeat-containing protein [Leptolyngbya sp. SIO1D8]|nr:pentapeptide repeat-containing protein [Leptolyngbya sp. SIO1D8]
MRRYYFAAIPLLSALFWAGSALAENPLVDIQPFNVRRLLTTNSCPDCDLVGANLRGTHLIGADLRKADLRGADLSWANLEGADLNDANLTGANLTGAFLTNATLVNADLNNANLSQAQIYFADVTDASMENVNLAEATIVGTPISIGGGAELEEEGSPIISPPEVWQLHPPGEIKPLPHNLIDVPVQIMPLL